MESTGYEGAKDRRKAYGQVLRDRIKAAQIIQRLQAFALGQELSGQIVDMSLGELKAAQILLNKVLPDLKAVEISAGDNRRLTRDDMNALLLSSGMPDIATLAHLLSAPIIDSTAQRIDGSENTGQSTACEPCADA